MVVLRIVFEDFWLLFVVKVTDEIVDAAGKLFVLELFSPFLSVEEPMVGVGGQLCLG